MIFITTNNANTLIFLFKEVDTLISIKKQINPYSYLLSFNSVTDELNFTEVIASKNTTSHDIFIIMMQDFKAPFTENPGTIILTSIVTDEETLRDADIIDGHYEPAYVEMPEDNRTEQEQLDELLDKVSNNGLDSLTSSEKLKLQILSK